MMRNEQSQAGCHCHQNEALRALKQREHLPGPVQPLQGLIEGITAQF